MEDYMLATYGMLGFVLAVGVAYLLYYLSQNVFNPTGKGAAARTYSKLRKFAGIRRFKVLSGVVVEAGGKSARIENLLIGFFGILMVHTLGARGEYYGTLDGAQWHIDLEGKRTSFPNPVLEQQKAATILRSIFSGQKLYNIPIEHIVYLTSKSKKSGLFITNSGEILSPGKLGAYLNKTRFEKDIGLDVEKVARAIEENRTAER